jgi:CheY-like chemotaxis protein
MKEGFVIPPCKRVMIVDDNEVDLYIGERNIQKYGFAEEVILKESAIKALEYLRSLAATPELLPDVIFLDIQMPQLNGFGFLEEYQKLPETVQKKCIVMMLSSSLNQDDHARAESNEFVSRFLTKPLNHEKLKSITEKPDDLSKAA